MRSRIFTLTMNERESNKLQTSQGYCFIRSRFGFLRHLALNYGSISYEKRVQSCKPLNIVLKIHLPQTSPHSEPNLRCKTFPRSPIRASNWNKGLVSLTMLPCIKSEIDDKSNMTRSNSRIISSSKEPMLGTST